MQQLRLRLVQPKEERKEGREEGGSTATRGRDGATLHCQATRHESSHAPQCHRIHPLSEQKGRQQKKNCWGVTFWTDSLQKPSGHNKFNKTAVLCSGHMWNDPGAPWHAQTGGPPLCSYRFLYGAERDRDDALILCWKKKNALLGN